MRWRSTGEPVVLNRASERLLNINKDKEKQPSEQGA
jgi:hypothetical protein